jgi:hypothetical protein
MSDATPAKLGRAFVAGIFAVVVAVIVGVAIAAALAGLGLTTTSPVRLGAWLAGTGLLGGWRQVVSSNVGGGLGWSTWAAGAPMLVTLAVLLTIALLARRTDRGRAQWRAALAAAAGAAVATLPLVAFSQMTQTTTNSAGSVTVVEGLTWFWTGGVHPGTVIGAAILAGGTWWINTAALDWWRQGRPLAYGLLIIPGLVLTVLGGAALYYLTSSVAVGVATLLLFPLLGVTALLGIGGAPAHFGLTRVSPVPYELWTWKSSLALGLGGLVLVLVIAALVGLILRLRRNQTGWLAGITVPVALAGFVALATNSVISVPTSLGGPTRISVNPLLAIVVAAVMAAVALLIRGRRRDAAAP